MVCAPEMIVAVILAGGLGTRLRDALPDRPKPMALVAGRPFLEWVVRYLAAQGVRRFVLSTGHVSEVVKTHFARGIGSLKVSCVWEREPLDTAGGFLNCVESVTPRPGWWLVCNGDSLAVADLGGILSATAAHGDVDGAILGVEVADTGRYGRLIVSDSGALKGFVDKRSGRGIINAGVYLLRDEFVRSLGQVRPLSFERDVFPEAWKDGSRLHVVVTNGAFLDIGTPQSLGQAKDFILTSLRPLLPDEQSPWL